MGRKNKSHHKVFIMKKLLPSDFVCMNDYEVSHALRVDLVYAQEHHPENIFKTQLYRTDAKLWLHKLLAEIVLDAANQAEKMDLRFVLKDGYRPVEAQALMAETDIVKQNPQWLIPPRMLSPAGMGGHPRGMAIDLELETASGKKIDYGTVFDELNAEGAPNKSARDYMDFVPQILENRKTLEGIMVRAGDNCGRELVPLPNEWWDFRLNSDFSNLYETESDRDLGLGVAL